MATTKQAWKKSRVHEGITLPSGVQVDIEIPNLPKMLKSGQVPNGLVDAAIKTQGAKQITRELLEETWDFYRWLLPQMVVKPEGLTADDVDELPATDIEMLVSFASRQTDLDAVGHQLGGLETQSSFRDFRGLITTDPDLLGV